jgi:hypothetical protein
MINKFAVAGPNSKYMAPGAEPAGFWAGFWHGSIAPITFIVGLFNPGVSLYERNNNGHWYDFGFLLGVMSAFGPKIQRGPIVKVDHDKEEEGGEIPLQEE